MRLGKNIGPKNRLARLVAAIILFALAYYYYDAANPLVWLAAILGIIFLAEAASSFCVLHGIRGTKDMR